MVNRISDATRDPGSSSAIPTSGDGRPAVEAVLPGVCFSAAPTPRASSSGRSELTSQGNEALTCRSLRTVALSISIHKLQTTNGTFQQPHLPWLKAP